MPLSVIAMALPEFEPDALAPAGVLKAGVHHAVKAILRPDLLDHFIGLQRYSTPLLPRGEEPSWIHTLAGQWR